MTDLLLQLQQDLADKLNSEAAFQYISCATYRSMVISQEIEKRVPHLTAKNGRKGCGVIVLMPTVSGIFPNVSPPQGEIKLSFWVVEQPEINFNQVTTSNAVSGTQLTCEQVARMIRQCVNLFQLEGKLALYQETAVIAPLIGLEKLYPGCCGYQVNMRGRMPELSVNKCAIPTLAEAPALTITLTTTDAGASIYYTLDGSFPGACNLVANNPAGTALLYTGPFTVAANTTIRWAGYLASYYGSDVGQAVIIS